MMPSPHSSPELVFGDWLPSILFSHILGIIIPNDELIFFRGVETTIYWVAFIIPIDEQKSFSEGWVYNHQAVKYITFYHMPYAMEPLTINDHHGEKPKTPMTVLLGGAPGRERVQLVYKYYN